METIYTIGHGNHSIGRFLNILKAHHINMLIDVRRRPGSRQFPQFNREPLKESVEKNGIKYHYLGDLIGGDPKFERYMKTERFLQGIIELERVIKNKTPVIMCSEFNYFRCHRRFISSALTEKEYAIKHIKKDGTLVAQDTSLSSF